MFNRLFIAKSGKEFVGRVVEKSRVFQSQIFNEANEKIFQSTGEEKPEQADRKMTFHFATIKNDN